MARQPPRRVLRARHLAGPPVVYRQLVNSNCIPSWYDMCKFPRADIGGFRFKLLLCKFPRADIGGFQPCIPSWHMCKFPRADIGGFKFRMRIQVPNYPGASM